MADKEHAYKGKAVTVRWNATRCLHVAECLKRSPAVFDVRRRVWVAPDGASADAVSETVRHCPTGALHVDRTDGIKERPPGMNRILSRSHGPLYVHGDLLVVDAGSGAEWVDTRVALCRCGASAEKPFCDNSHLAVNFRDSGKVGLPPGAAADSASGKLTITATANGPFALHGCAEIVAANGWSVRVENAELCRCGASRNKPFCDGSHKDVEFISGAE